MKFEMWIFNVSTITENSTVPHAENYVLLAWLTTILSVNFFGTIFNVLLLFVMAFHPPLRRSSSYALIVHCILIDLYITAVSVPMSTVPTFLGPTYQLPEYYCLFKVMFVYASYAASINASCLLAIQRLIAAVSPKYTEILSRKPALFFMLLIPWCVAIFVDIIPAFGFGVRLAHVNSWVAGSCIYVSSSDRPYGLIVYAVVAYFLPTVVMTVSYVLVLVKTRRALRRKRSSRLLQRRLEISRTLCLSCVWHCLTIYPGTIINNLSAEKYVANVALQLSVRWFANSFSAINPVFFLASSKLFQDGIKHVLGCRPGMKAQQETLDQVLLKKGDLRSIGK
ncbi:hypothetical protein BV898_14717 [Hypsibius exemplaris]|uniref:G-protein coupled receptors family 1 profile domain-containing protein n=1 Tax=Hypsibius exemplaris TaxID=2072580 RepID=A0A9X6N9A3_HYPEX|nr:hypothetical protein BV898_14717 [Hypsibius exemplaris]